MRRHGLALTLDADLAEIDFGDWDAADPADAAGGLVGALPGPSQRLAWRRAHCRFSGALRAPGAHPAPAWASKTASICCC